MVLLAYKITPRSGTSDPGQPGKTVYRQREGNRFRRDLGRVDMSLYVVARLLGEPEALKTARYMEYDGSKFVLVSSS